jgi:hypothetical protein
VNGDSEFGWGDTESEGPAAFGSVGSALLIVASGVYCAALWLAGGLPPLAYLASRVREQGCQSSQGVKSIR